MRQRQWGQSTHQEIITIKRHVGVWWWWGAVQDAGPEVKRRKIIHKTSGVEVSKKIKGKESITSTVKKKKNNSTRKLD